MNWNEYRTLALRTESIPQNFFGMVPTVEIEDMYDTALDNEKATRLLHAALGLCTELNEQESGDGVVNHIEECGDVLWYLAILDDVIDWFNCPYEPESGPKQSANFYVGEIQDTVKRHIFYGTPLDLGRLRISADRIYGKVGELLENQLGLAMEANIRKLEKRFPDKMFTAQAAVHRDVDRELDHILESGELIPKLESLELGEDEGLAELVVVDIDTLIEEAEEALANKRTELGEKEWKAFLTAVLSKNQIENMAMELVTSMANHYAELGANDLSRAYGSLYLVYSGQGSKLKDSSLWVIWNALGYATDEAGIRDKLQRWM